MIYVRLTKAETETLRQLSERERRKPADQAAYLVVEGLKRRGLLAPASTREHHAEDGNEGEEER